MALTRIHKYELNPSQLTIEMPEESKILKVDSQRNKICIWAEVDPDLISEKRYFEVYGTGHLFKEGLFGKTRKYIGTAKLHSESLIMHVYELCSINNNG